MVSACSHLQHRLARDEGKRVLAVSAWVPYKHALPEAVGGFVVGRKRC